MNTTKIPVDEDIFFSLTMMYSHQSYVSKGTLVKKRMLFFTILIICHIIYEHLSGSPCNNKISLLTLGLWLPLSYLNHSQNISELNVIKDNPWTFVLM